MKLKQLTIIKTDFEGADFWVTRRGSISEVGRPVKSFSKYHIGIKVTATEILLPDYLYYAIMMLHSKGYFKAIARGTLALQHITTEDLKNIEIG